jgi:zinc protease
VGEQIVYGLAPDFYSTFVPKALAVGVPEVARAARLVDPDNAVIVVVGDRKTIEPKLRALGLGEVTVRSVDEVLGVAPKIE